MEGGCYKESKGGRIIHQWNIKSYIIVYIVQRFCSCLKGVVLPERVAEISKEEQGEYMEKYSA